MLLEMGAPHSERQAFEPDRTVVAKAGIFGTGLDDEYVMLDPVPGVYYGLNVVGTAIWQFIQQPRRLGDIQQHVCAAFDVTPDRCAADIRQLVADLVSRGLASYVDALAETPPAPDAV
jgi:hypothetical protein